MTSLLQKINTLDTKVDGLDSSNLQTQITTNTNDISTLQINKQNTLTAGDNITIVDNVISSSGGGSGTTESVASKVFYAVTSAPVNMGSVTSYISSFDTIVKTNTTLYNFTNNKTVTVLQSGNYKVEFNCSFYNVSYTDRSNLLTSVLINGVSDKTYGGQAACYLRHKDYARNGTTTNSLFFACNANDTIQLQTTMNKASDLGSISNFSSQFEFIRGSNILVTYLD